MVQATFAQAHDTATAAAAATAVRQFAVDYIAGRVEGDELEARDSVAPTGSRLDLWTKILGVSAAGGVLLKALVDYFTR